MCSDLPTPTVGQCEEFAQHICWAHSWYKHLPLFAGGEFVFFLSKNAGTGYSEGHRRTHYSWQKTAEYRERFGHLDYMYRCPDSDIFYRDTSSESITLSEEILSLCSVRLYPFISNDFNAEDVLYRIIDTELIEQLKVDNSHPKRPEILAWYEAFKAKESKWNELSVSESELFIAISIDEEIQGEKPAQLPVNVAEYLDLERTSLNLYLELHESELNKIRSALSQLRNCLEQGMKVWF